MTPFSDARLRPAALSLALSLLMLLPTACKKKDAAPAATGEAGTAAATAAATEGGGEDDAKQAEAAAKTRTGSGEGDPTKKPEDTLKPPAAAPPVNSADAQPIERPILPDGAKAHAQFVPLNDTSVAGFAALYEVEGGIKFIVRVENLAPGKRGLHVHEKGDCSDTTGAGAGGHFNPGGHAHALPGKDPRHLGDLGNIATDERGVGDLTIEIKGATLKEGDANSVLGRAIILHADEDDGSGEAGNAGQRIGCATIKAGPLPPPK